MSVLVLRARGTGEAYRPQLLDTITDPLPRTRFRVEDVQYDAEIGPGGGNPLGQSMDESVEQCARSIARQVDAASEWHVVLVGYSLGAAGITRYAVDWSRRLPYTAGQNITGVLPVANPYRRPGPGLDGFGIAGALHPDPSRRLEWLDVANQRDGIPCSPERSPLRSFADVGAVLTLDLNRETVRAWATLLSAEAWQLAHVDWSQDTLVSHAQRYLFAASQLWGYLDGSAHVRDYYVNGLLAWGTKWIVDTDWEIRR